MKIYRLVLASLLLASTTQAFVAPHRTSGTTATTRLQEAVTTGPAASVNPQLTQDCWNLLDAPPVLCQGGNTLKTFVVPAGDPAADSMQILMRSPGDRPVHATIELWYTPSYLPTKVDVYLEDGRNYPFNCIFDTPYQNTIGIYNTAAMEYPLEAAVSPAAHMREYKQDFLAATQPPDILQGMAIKTYQFDPSVQSVQVLLQTAQRHLHCRLEVIEGPNNVKQALDIYSSDGKKRPFYCVLETPFPQCTIRLVNSKTIEYPILASVAPLVVEE